MHETNICSGLEIETLPFQDVTVRALYARQQALQTRLKQVYPMSYSERATKLIYWRHCIHTECDELLEWFKSVTPEPSATTLKEMRMEAIDILHFVFNLGITAEILPGQAQAIYDNTPTVIDMTPENLPLRLKVAVCNLSDKLTQLIDLFPWKTWKSYNDFEIDIKAVDKAFGYVLASTYALCHLLDMHEQMVGEYFVAKNKENHARQDRGY